MRAIKIEGVDIGKEYPCYIIAEIGVNHNGQLSFAKKLIDASIESGANAVKFQKRDLKSLYRKESLEKMKSRYVLGLNYQKKQKERLKSIMN